MEKKANVVRAAKTTYIVASALVLLLGAMILIFKPVSILRFLVGGCFLCVGATKLFGFFSNDLYKLAFQFDLALGFLTLIVGLVLLIRRDISLPMVAVIAGLYVLVDALFKIQTALDARKFGMSKWVIILISAILADIVGLLTLFDPFRNVDAESLLILIAIAFILNGMQNIWTTAYTVRVKAKKKNVEEKYETYL